MEEVLNCSKLDPELDLLGDDPSVSEEHPSANHAIRTAPVFTGDALEALGANTIPQRALYGRLIERHSQGASRRPEIPKVYINTNAPFSAVVCGVQGSGKSHSTSVLLESSLMSDPRIGTLPEPLSALVFHFDTAAGGGLVQPCEAAFLSARNPKLQGADIAVPPVTVLVVPSYLQAMIRVYSRLPGVRVEPLLFAPKDISGERLLSMMKVDDGAQMPLYMESIMTILRSMQDHFDYATFRTALTKQGFNPSQMAMLKLRLSLLDACLKDGDAANSVTTYFKKGHLTIIDMSSPFMDGASACGFFDMILGLFVEAKTDASGKIVVLDEAHKYLSELQSGSSAKLTDSLLTVIRQQRHLATRVVISTQEPTVVPSKFLALCSIIIAHRFSSPTWLRELAQHVSAAHSSMEQLLAKIISLPTGQAIMFAPSALTLARTCPESALESCESDAGRDRVVTLGEGYFLVRSRLRVTCDGGHSLLAVPDPKNTTRVMRPPSPAPPLTSQNAGGVVRGTVGDAASSADAVTVTVPAAPMPTIRKLIPEFTGSTVIETSVSSDGAFVSDSEDEINGVSYPAPSVTLPPPAAAPQQSRQQNTPGPVKLVDKAESPDVRYGRFARLAQVMLSASCKAYNGDYVQIPTLCGIFVNSHPTAYGATAPVVRRVIEDAVAAGLLKKRTNKNNPRVTLLDMGARGTKSPISCPSRKGKTGSTSRIWVLGDDRARFAPLLKFILQRMHDGPHVMSIVTLYTDFKAQQTSAYMKVEKFRMLINEAVQERLLSYHGSDKLSLAPLPDCTYILPK